MMYMRDISQFIQGWIFPPGLIVLLFVIGVILAKRIPKMGRGICYLAIALLWALSTPIVGQQLIDMLQTRFAPVALTIVSTNNPDHAAIIVLGSGVENAREYDRKHTISSSSLSRLLYAAYLNQKLKLPIIVSGGNRDQSAHTEAEIMSDILKTQLGVIALAQETKSRNTAEEALHLQPILEQHHIHQLYIVTHAWHMPRSIFAFRKLYAQKNFAIIAAPTGYISLMSRDTKANYMPSLKALNASVYALHEYLGLLWYKIIL